MRVQHVWAKTGTSPVAFHNTTRDVALCPASEHRPGRVFAEIKGLKYGHIERTRATVAPPHSPDGWAALLPGLPGLPGLLFSRVSLGSLAARRPATRGCGWPAPCARSPAPGARSYWPWMDDLGAHAGAGKPGVFATLETFVPVLVALPGSGRTAGADSGPGWLGGSHDRVSLGAAPFGRRPHRVPLRAIYDLNGTQ